MVTKGIKTGYIKCDLCNALTFRRLKEGLLAAQAVECLPSKIPDHQKKKKLEENFQKAKHTHTHTHTHTQTHTHTHRGD
jgi:hypothetical protein